MSEDPVKAVQVKLVLLGEAAVGKSSLVLRFVSNDFNENTSPTIGAAFLTQKCRLENRVVKFEIWDTAGQERFHSLAPMYYRNAQAAVVAYDITKASSLEKAKSWVKELQRQASPNIVIALVGNKLDLVAESDAAGAGAVSSKSGIKSKSSSGSSEDGENEDEEGTKSTDDAGAEGEAEAEDAAESLRQISTAEASAYARESNLLFFEASAKAGTNVKELFDEIARTIPLDTPGGAGAGGAGGAGGVGGAGAAGSAAAGRGRRDGQEVRLGDEQGKKGGCC